MKNNMKPLEIGDLKASLPIVQGGMGIGVSMSGLASAVANEGGIGVISAAAIGIFEKGMTRDFEKASIEGLEKEIRKARKLTKGILGVNIMGVLTNFADMVKTSIAEKIDIIFVGAGLPLDLPKYLLDKAKTKLIPIVSSARAALLIAKRWIEKFNYIPDGFVVEGPLAGGHLGFKIEDLDKESNSLENILVEVLSALKPLEEKYSKKIPVIVAGGIYTGEDIYKFMEKGAAGVQMATRFVPTIECDASEAFKQAYVNCKEDDIELIDSPVGLPGRAIKSHFIEESRRGNKKPFVCPYHCITTCKKEESPYCISLALFSAQKGVLNNGFVFAGVNAYRTERIVSVKDLVNEIHLEYNTAIKNN